MSARGRNRYSHLSKILTVGRRIGPRFPGCYLAASEMLEFAPYPSNGNHTTVSPLRYIATFALLLAFAGQGLAAVSLSCSQGTAPMEHQGMEHDGHAGHHGTSDASDAPAADCCDGGYCSQSGCLLLSAAADEPGAALQATTRSASARFDTARAILSPDSLYRPPASG